MGTNADTETKTMKLQPLKVNNELTKMHSRGEGAGDKSLRVLSQIETTHNHLPLCAELCSFNDS